MTVSVITSESMELINSFLSSIGAGESVSSFTTGSDVLNPGN